MSGFLAAGILAFAAVGGYRLLRYLVPRAGASRLERVVIGTALGIASLTPLLVIAAWTGTFRLTALGGIGWAATLLLLAGTRSVDRPTRRLDAVDVLALAVAIGFCVIAITGRDETLAAGRDQQLYAEFAVALAERGSPEIHYVGLDAADRTLLRESPALRIPGTPVGANGVDSAIRTTHPLGWSVWLAIAHAIAGVDGMYAANAVVFVLGGLLFYLLVRKVSHPALALAATVALFTAPSTLWIGGVTLSEPLAMALLLAVPLVVAAGPIRSTPAAALLLLGAALIRLDSLLALVAALAAWLVTAGASGRRRALWAARRSARTLLLALAATLLAYAVFNRTYLLEFAAGVRLMALAAVGLAVVLEVGPPSAFVARAFRMRSPRVVAAAVLIALFAYAALVRPTLQPFSLISHDSGLDGTRDFREDSLLNLAAYVSWPALVLGLTGTCYCLLRGWLGRRGLFAAMLLTMGLGPALLYLWSPQISPDHPWAARRFVPQVIPFVLLFASVFVTRICRRGGGTLLFAGASLVVIPALSLLRQYPDWWATFRENEGVTATVEEIARAMPDRLVVAMVPDENIAAALAVAFGRTVAVSDNYRRDPDDVEQTTRWIAAKAASGQPAFLLHGPELPRTGLLLQDEHRWDVPAQRIHPSTRAPVSERNTTTSTVALSRVTGLDPTFPQRMFGGESPWGARESGFYASEVAPFGTFRYTDGAAKLAVPAAPLRDAIALKVDVFAFAPPGESRALRIAVDGEQVWTGRVAGGVTTVTASLARPPTRDVVEIAIESEVIAPTTTASPDGRRLGVGLIGIRPLRTGEPSTTVLPASAYRSRLAAIAPEGWPMHVRAGGDAAFVLEVENTGSAYWASLRELGTPAGAVQIVLRWHRRGSGEIVADNRWGLAVSMHPGDRTRIAVPLKPIGLDGAPLPPGEYDLRVGMVRETIALFSDGGDLMLALPIVVSP